MYAKQNRWWFPLSLLITVFLFPAHTILAQESSSAEVNTAEARVHVAGPDVLFLDGVVIGDEQYAVYLSAGEDGQWRVTSVEPINRRVMPADVILDMAQLSVPDSGELRIDNIYLDGQFYSGTVAFDPSLRQIQRYEFSASSPPDPTDSTLLSQLAESYEIGRSSEVSQSSTESPAPSASAAPSEPPASPPPSVDLDPVLQRLDQYAAQGAERLDRLEARIDELAWRVDGAVEDGSRAVAALMGRVVDAPAADGHGLAPTLSLSRARAEMASVDIPDLSAGTPVTGSWRADGPRRVSQTDPDARFAKLVLPYRQDSRPRLYRVLTRAPGREWAGVGLHLGVTDVEVPLGYGHGRSILVWLTRDFQTYGNETTFLEVYISYDDVTMNRVAQTALDSELSATSALEVLMDPGSGMLTIAVDGVEQFRYRVNLPQGAGMELALRALGEGEFSDLEVRRR